MDDFTPVPYGALRAVFRDPEADNGLMVLPIVGFTSPPSTGEAAVFGGPLPGQTFKGRPPAANEGAVGIPVLVTRRGELRTTITHTPNAAEAGDPMFSASPTVGLVPDVEPGPEFLGIVQSHEDAAEVFRDHLDAAEAHRAAVEASGAAQDEPVELPPRTVPAEVTTPAPEAFPAETRRDLDALLAHAQQLGAAARPVGDAVDEDTDMDEDEW